MTKLTTISKEMPGRYGQLSAEEWLDTFLPGDNFDPPIEAAQSGRFNFDHVSFNKHDSDPNRDEDTVSRASKLNPVLVKGLRSIYKISGLTFI